MSLLLEILIHLSIIGFLCEYIAATLGMGYGTLLAPILIIIGYEPIVLVPVILISQFFAALIASAFHHKLKNMNIFYVKEERLAIGIFITTGTFGVLLASFANIIFPSFYVKTYIAFVVVAVGILMLRNNQNDEVFSKWKLAIVGTFAAFNKGISGAGYGLISNSGQILSGINPRAAIAITAFVQSIICILGAILYYLFVGPPSELLTIGITIGAVIAAPISALTTSKLDQSNIKKVVAASTLSIGCFTLAWILLI